jgi:hypothetical protein
MLVQFAAQVRDVVLQLGDDAMQVFQVLYRVDQERAVAQFRIPGNFRHTENSSVAGHVIYAGGMSDNMESRGVPAEGPRGEPGEGAPWGRALDVAGAVAAVVIVAILVDIWTDGRLISRHLPGRRQPPPPGGTQDE